MILSQAILIFSAIYAIFGIINEKKRFLLYIFLAMGLSFLSYFNITIRINNLLVDFLLPIYTLASFSIAYKYRYQSQKALFLTLAPLAFLTIIKSTGIIFAAIGLIFLLAMIFKYRSKKNNLKILLLALLTILLSLLPYLAWSLHTEQEFKGVENKFDIQELSIDKSQNEIQEIVDLFITSSIDLSTRSAQGILVSNVISIIAIIFNKLFFHKKWRLLKALISLNLVLILYYLGILALYIFSMPIDEAIYLAGFDRYSASIVILFVGSLFLTSTIDLENSFHYKIGEVEAGKEFLTSYNKHFYQRAVVFCLALTLTMLLSEYNGMLSIANDYRNSISYKLETITNDRWYLNGYTDNNSYLVYATDTDSQISSYYLQYISSYYLYAPKVDGTYYFKDSEIEQQLSNYDYLIIVESNINSRYLIYKHFGISGVEGIYQINKSNNSNKISLKRLEKDYYR